MTTHRCPPDGSGETPCCDLSPLELPLDDRMTVDGEVDCDGGVVRCPSCGQPMASGGFALACGRGGASARIPLPATCRDPACLAARDEAAIEQAITAGVIRR